MKTSMRRKYSKSRGMQLQDYGEKLTVNCLQNWLIRYFIRTFVKGEKECSPWQRVPTLWTSHWHWYMFTRSKHVPPYRHGLLWHSLMFAKNQNKTFLYTNKHATILQEGLICTRYYFLKVECQYLTSSAIINRLIIDPPSLIRYSEFKNISCKL